MEKLKELYLKRIESGGALGTVEKTLASLSLNTVCRSARCPNRSECYSRGTATFLIMGPRCTRNCRYCSVEKGAPLPLDENEPYRIAEAVKRLGLKYAVVTSTTRDDLPEGGLEHFVKTVKAIKEASPDTEVEVLVPDFGGKWERLQELLASGISVFNHNIEVVERLFPSIRPGAKYERSLNLLKKASEDGRVIVKSGFMVGLGETLEEVESTLFDLKESGVDVVTVGQYLRPTRNHMKPVKFYDVKDFEKIKDAMKRLNFSQYFVGPFVRSSYNAFEVRKEFLENEA